MAWLLHGSVHSRCSYLNKMNSILDGVEAREVLTHSAVSNQQKVAALENLVTI